MINPKEIIYRQVTGMRLDRTFFADDNRRDRIVKSFRPCVYRYELIDGAYQIPNSYRVIDTMTASCTDSGFIIFRNEQTASGFLSQHNDTDEPNHSASDLQFIGKSRIVTVGANECANILDIETQTRTHSFHSHQSSIYRCAVNHYDQNVFAVGTKDGGIFVFDLRQRSWLLDRRNRRKLKFTASIPSAIASYEEIVRKRSFSSGVCVLKDRNVVSPGRGRPNTAAKRRRIEVTTYPINSLTFCGDRQIVASAHRFETGIRIYDIRQLQFENPIDTIRLPTNDCDKFIDFCVNRTGTRLFIKIQNKAEQYLVWAANLQGDKRYEIIARIRAQTNARTVTSQMASHPACDVLFTMDSNFGVNAQLNYIDVNTYRTKALFTMPERPYGTLMQPHQLIDINRQGDLIAYSDDALFALASNNSYVFKRLEQSNSSTPLPGFKLKRNKIIHYHSEILLDKTTTSLN